MPGSPLSHRLLLDSDVDYVKRYGVVEHWPLNEASGAALATINHANDLTDNNTVTSSTGKVYALARQFTAANSESLSLADNARVRPGNNDFFIDFWINPNAIGSLLAIASKYSGLATYRLFLLANGKIRFQIFNAAGAGAGQVDSTEVLTAATWTNGLVYVDSVNSLVGVCVNGGAPTTAAKTDITGDDTGTFVIGAQSATNYFDGLIGPMVFGKSPPLGIAALKTEIRDRLWANGAGRAYPWK